jgi:hypothetical protein
MAAGMVGMAATTEITVMAVMVGTAATVTGTATVPAITTTVTMATVPDTIRDRIMVTATTIMVTGTTTITAGEVTDAITIDIPITARARRSIWELASSVNHLRSPDGNCRPGSFYSASACGVDKVGLMMR